MLYVASFCQALTVKNSFRRTSLVYLRLVSSSRIVAHSNFLIEPACRTMSYPQTQLSPLSYMHIDEECIDKSLPKSKIIDGLTLWKTALPS